MIIFYMIPVKLPFLLSDLKLGNAAQAGMAIACSTLASGITSTQFQKVRAKFNFSAITSFVFLLRGIGYTVIALSNTYLQILLGLIISGLGMGLLIPNLNVGLVEIIPLKLRGRAVGGLTTTIFLGQFFSPLVSQPISNATSLSFSYLIMGIFMLVVSLGFGWTQFKAKPKLS
ncbi:MAG: MFS transporter [Crinalium sp.]